MSGQKIMVRLSSDFIEMFLRKKDLLEKVRELHGKLFLTGHPHGDIDYSETIATAIYQSEYPSAFSEGREEEIANIVEELKNKFHETFEEFLEISFTENVDYVLTAALGRISPIPTAEEYGHHFKGEGTSIIF